MRLFLIALMYFEAAVGTAVFYHDNSNACKFMSTNRCTAFSVLTGGVWPLYWSTVAWRIALNEGADHLLSKPDVLGHAGHDSRNE